MTIDEKFMLQALELARRGGRSVAPNPMVGAVIVKKDRVIGKGYHQQFGGPHAEVNAIQSVKRKADLEGATLYVTLEPCRHFGKTPPCLGFAEVMGVERVVCGSHDPFQQSRNTNLPPQLRGMRNTKKLEFLKGQISQKCKELNKFFFEWVEKKRPFITVKIAMSIDGFVAGVGGKPVRFTTAKQDREVHQLRSQHQAILVGINTVLNDDPGLNVRHVKGKDPLRIVLDSKLQMPKKAKVLKGGNYLIATCKKTNHQDLNVWVCPTQKQVSLKKLFRHLADNGISSVLVEPGPTLYQSLKKQGLIDELRVYRSKKKLGQGVSIHL